MLHKQLYEYDKPEATICSQIQGRSHLLPATSSSTPLLLWLHTPRLGRHQLPHISAAATPLTLPLKIYSISPNITSLCVL